MGLVGRKDIIRARKDPQNRDVPARRKAIVKPDLNVKFRPNARLDTTQVVDLRPLGQPPRRLPQPGPAPAASPSGPSRPQPGPAPSRPAVKRASTIKTGNMDR